MKNYWFWRSKPMIWLANRFIKFDNWLWRKMWGRRKR